MGSTDVAPFINGVAVGTASLEKVEVRNPSTGRRALLIPTGCERDIDEAVRSARVAFESGTWSEAPPAVRGAALTRLADRVAAHATELDALDAEEMGKPVSERFCDARAAAELLRFSASALDKITGDCYQSDRKSVVFQRWAPLGVVGAVVPWNFPTYVAIQKLAPALAVGNSMVIKPSELSSRSAIRIAELAIEAGVPEGVLNVVPGLGSTAGKALALHADVDMVTFTGSTTVGKLVLQYAGQSNLKRVAVECGGKSPQIVFADAGDLDPVADTIARSMLTNQSQLCSVGSRLLVQRGIEYALLEKLVERLERIVPGDARDPRTTFGPLASEEQLRRVQTHIRAAQEEGAGLVAGGGHLLAESGGYFVEPTVFRNVSPSARLAQEEVFGPVLSVIAFDRESDALRIANDTIYGLAAYVWTSDLAAGLRMAKGLRSSVTLYSAQASGEGAGPVATWEPAKQSGFGPEGGLAGLQSYMRRQLVEIYHA